VGQAQIAKNFGLSGDADVGPHARQLALLDLDDFSALAVADPTAWYGSSGENMVVEGLGLKNLRPGTRIRSGDALMELVGPEPGGRLFRARAILAGIVTEEDQILVE
jgi:MOSC domain-containing protein YiiM